MFHNNIFNQQTLFRAVTSQIFGLPNRPQIELVVAYGPLRDDENRVHNYIDALKIHEPHRTHFFQRIDYD